MSKRLVIEPYWLHCLLMDWAFASFPKGGGLGYPSKCTYLAERIPQQAASREPWEVTTAEKEDVAKEIEKLEDRHKHAITRAYKPWCVPSIDEMYPGICGSAKVWARLAREAAQILAVRVEERRNARSVEYAN